MTDEELIKRLREIGKFSFGWTADQAADRIEALTAERDEHWKSFVHWRKEADDRAEQLEAARADAKEAETYAEELERERKRVADINANHCRTINTYVLDNAKLAAALKEAVGLIKGWYHWDDERQLRGGAPSNYTEAARAFLAKHGEQR